MQPSRVLHLLLSLLIIVWIVAGCAGPAATPPAPPPTGTMPTPPPAPTSPSVPTPTPSPTPTPTPTSPPVLVIPSAILNSHFGFCDATQWGFGDATLNAAQNAQELSNLGIGWDRPLPGPFSWYQVEKEKGKYDWSIVDQYVQWAQKYGFATEPIIWPFNTWDQAQWGPSTSTKRFGNTKELGTGRRKPYDMNAYMSFVSALVERYDGDGKNDMLGLKW